jgi:hypothetical protein
VAPSRPCRLRDAASFPDEAKQHPESPRSGKPARCPYGVNVGATDTRNGQRLLPVGIGFNML